MRLANLTFPTRQPFERAATYPHQQFLAGAVAPHAGTVRFTYTVPTNRIALLTAVHVKVRRETAPTTAGLVSAFVYLTDPTANVYRFASVSFVSSTVGAQDWFSGYVGTFVPAGWSVSAQTGDSSTGGTCAYEISVHIVEFTP
jgi:hypothetical protein